MEKKGQMVIFIVIGIVLVAGIVLFLFFLGDSPLRVGEEVGEQNIRGFMETCLKDDVADGIKLISLRGGSIENPLNISYKLEREENPVDISYLCYSYLDLLPCVNQQPMLFQRVSGELKKYIEDDVEECFYGFVGNLERRGYSVEKDYRGVEVTLRPQRVELEILADLTVSRGDQTLRYENFEVLIGTEIYDILMVVNRIVNDETQYCDFNRIAYMQLNPPWRIRVYDTMDFSRIYMIEHKETGGEFRFAVRGCAPTGGAL